MPALGLTITEAVVVHARATLPDGEFRRAFLNQPTKADERVNVLLALAAVCADARDPLCGSAALCPGGCART